MPSKEALSQEVQMGFVSAGGSTYGCERPPSRERASLYVLGARQSVQCLTPSLL